MESEVGERPEDPEKAIDPVLEAELKSATIETPPQPEPKEASIKKPSRGRAIGGFSRFKLVVMCAVAAALDFSGLYSNWSFSMNNIRPLFSPKGIIAINGTYNVPDYDTGWYNVSMAVCNPSTESQAPAKSWMQFLFMYSVLGLCITTLFFTLALCIRKPPTTFTWILKFQTMDEYGNLGEDGMKTMERNQSMLLFFTQDFIFLVLLGFYTGSCTSQGTFSSWISFFGFVVSVVNAVRRLHFLLMRVVREHGWAILLGLFAPPCPGWCILILVTITGSMIIIPMVRFFTRGDGLILVQKINE